MSLLCVVQEPFDKRRMPVMLYDESDGIAVSWYQLVDSRDEFNAHSWMTSKSKMSCVAFKLNAEYLRARVMDFATFNQRYPENPYIPAMVDMFRSAKEQ